VYGCWSDLAFMCLLSDVYISANQQQSPSDASQRQLSPSAASHQPSTPNAKSKSVSRQGQLSPSAASHWPSTSNAKSKSVSRQGQLSPSAASQHSPFAIPSSSLRQPRSSLLCIDMPQTCGNVPTAKGD